MTKALIVLVAVTCFAFILPSAVLHAQNAVVNSQFSGSHLQHWSGTDPSLHTGTGPNYLGMDWVCLHKTPGHPDNNGMVEQQVHLIKGYTYRFSAKIAAQLFPDCSPISTDEGGIFEVEIGEENIAMHDFGFLASESPEAATLEGIYVPEYTGFHALQIKNYRPTQYASGNLWNFVDVVTLEPEEPMLSSDGVVFSVQFGSTITLELTAGPEYANKQYWIFTGMSGTFPGTNVAGGNVPLNFDPLVHLCLLNPGFPGLGILGRLDEEGNAIARIYWKPEQTHLWMTLYFSYVVLSPGMSPPILAASNPVNATVVKYW